MPEDAAQTGQAAGQGPARGFSVRRLLPLAILLAGLVLFFVLDLDEFTSFEALRTYRAELREFVGANPILAGLVYALAYVVVVAFSLPGGAVMTIAGGFLFGTVAATAITVVAATAGATVLFLVARTALGDPLRARAGPWLRKMEAGFQENAASYLLVLRLVPLFPFFVVNVVPAFLGVSLRDYVLYTFVGIIPGTFVFASVGAGLDSVFAAGEHFTPSSVLTPEIILALVGLAVLALIPVLYKTWKRRSR
jgi:uncharacterized membrane protein YdjX (TVP38/TMEM64 family)